MNSSVARKLDRVLYLLFLLGLVSLAFLAGGTLVYFGKQPFDLIDGAYDGVRAWQKEIGIITKSLDRVRDIVHDDTPTVVKKPGAFEGYTLFNINPDISAHAELIDMDGKVVHKWSLPYSKFPTPATMPLPYYPDGLFYWHDTWVFPNGDLIAVIHNNGYCPYGAGLVKLDKDSNVIWSYGEHVNHRVEVKPNGGVVALIHDNAIRPEVPGLSNPHRVVLYDHVVWLNRKGKELRRISLLKAMGKSKYTSVMRDKIGGDPLHPNSVMTLTKELAPAFPMFHEGQVLISMRNIDAIAVLDPKKQEIVWLAQGSWKKQHYARFTKQGTIMLFDNRGGDEKGNRSRVLEYNPATKKTTIFYQGSDEQPFFSGIVGMFQDLPNGNTLITETTNGRILEINHKKEIVWQFTDPYHYKDKPERPFNILTGRRYTADELPFLKEKEK